MWKKSLLRCWFVAPLVILVMFRMNHNLWNQNSGLKVLDSVFPHRSTCDPHDLFIWRRTVGANRQDLTSCDVTWHEEEALKHEASTFWWKARIKKAAETSWVKSSWLTYNHAWGWRGRGSRWVLTSQVSSLQFQAERFCFLRCHRWTKCRQMSTDSNHVQRPICLSAQREAEKKNIVEIF